MVTGASVTKRTILLDNMGGSVVLWTTRFTTKDNIHTLSSKRSHHHQLQNIINSGRNGPNWCLFIRLTMTNIPMTLIIPNHLNLPLHPHQVKWRNNLLQAKLKRKLTRNVIVLGNPGDKGMVTRLFSTTNLVILSILIRKSILFYQLRTEEVDGRSILAERFPKTITFLVSFLFNLAWRRLC